MLENLTSNDEVAGALADKYLLPDERGRWIAVRQHPAALCGPVLCLAVVVAAATALTALDLPQDATAGAWVLAAAGVVVLAYQVASWTLRWTVVTRDRVLSIAGRKATIFPVNRAAFMTVDRPLVGRVLGFGSLRFETLRHHGETVTLRYLPRAEELQREISALIYGGKKGGR